MTAVAIAFGLVSFIFWVSFETSNPVPSLRHFLRAFLLISFLGCLFIGPEFVLLGWGINLFVGFLHWRLIEDGDLENIIGTLVLVSYPWAQTVLTIYVIGSGLISMALNKLWDTMSWDGEDDE